eukprot:TRINITY_DN17169_c0_g1_i1.p1 TRINITY_DN17169_c0_g1~~TRINITY_DN17169_c0_g1_i1.p1  ORF type:complete len:436 (+),score=67.28 TRINITY_DN17169_c0_g1_i1:160-1467(+)
MMSISSVQYMIFATSTAISVLASSMFTVPLQKQRVPVMVKGRVVSHKAAYFGTVLVGNPRPQNFTVVFDTGSAHFILPSSSCDEESCRNHQRYDRSVSDSAIEINHDGSRVRGRQQRDEVVVSYGTGKVSGAFVSEIACLGPNVADDEFHTNDKPNCARARIIHANSMSSEPFNHFLFDGVVGLGLEGLALDPEFSFFSQLSRNGRVAPVFGVFLAPGEDAGLSEITFGGHNEARAASPLHWVPVVSPKKGYWQVSIKSIYVGSEKLDLCNDGDCVAILDTGMSTVGVPKSASSSIHLKLARPSPPESAGDVDCKTVPGPNFTFNFDGFSIDLEASDYSRPAAMVVPRKDASDGPPHVICRASLLPMDLPPLGPNAFLLGEPVLQKYYTAYDTHKQRIGFARSVPATEAEVATQRVQKSPDMSLRRSIDRSVVIV